MAITHRAQVRSEHYSYEGFGSSEESARLTLLEGLRMHAKEMTIEASWPDEMIGQASVTVVKTGRATFTLESNDAQSPAPLVMIEGSPAVANLWICRVETKDVDSRWGCLETYGRTKENATGIMTQAVSAILKGVPDAINRAGEIVEALQYYRIREGGAYRGGLVGSAGEALLDAHIPPELPDGIRKWLPTTRMTITRLTMEGTTFTGEAVARPDRQNRMGLTRMIDTGVPAAMRPVLESFESRTTRDNAKRILDAMLPGLVVGAMVSREGSLVPISMGLEDGSVMTISFTQEETTPASIVESAA
jgi:hypothetical protein